MGMTSAGRAVLPLALFVVWAAPARAQLFESVGTRAQGMGGAFVAVADDATASWWNPAGLATGAIFNTIFEFNNMREPRFDHDASGRPQAVWDHDVRSVAMGYPALGFSFYRLKMGEITPALATADSVPDRQDQGLPLLRSLALNQYSTTFGQSIGAKLVVASTLKLLRGTPATQVATTADATVEDAHDLSGDVNTSFDLDLGVMASFGSGRLGLAVKNVTRPSFGTDTSTFQLERQVRAGLALGTNSRKGATAFVLAADADLTKIPTSLGYTRRVAVGFETWAPNRRVGFRSGVNASTIGESRPTASAGLSLALRAGSYLEGQYTVGRDVSRQGWGAGFRVSY
jgi:hypothetical protein